MTMDLFTHTGEYPTRQRDTRLEGIHPGEYSGANSIFPPLSLLLGKGELLTGSDGISCFCPPLQHCLTEIEVLAIVFAAAIHDYEHTGTTNSFHIQTK